MEETIELKKCNTSSFSIEDFKFDRVSLTPDYLIHRYQFSGKKLTDMGEVEDSYDVEKIILKHIITGIVLTDCTDEEAFKVDVTAIAESAEEGFMFHSRKDAVDFMNKILQWLMTE